MQAVLDQIEKYPIYIFEFDLLELALDIHELSEIKIIVIKSASINLDIKRIDSKTIKFESKR
jgi:hypothetical protein